jgi:malate dehydrogenase (oxaloacetate-decarboxylating)(NADP+)
MVTQNEIDEGRIYPDLKRIRDVSFQIALKVGRYALENGLCNKHIKPEMLDDLIKTNIYKSDYDNNSKNFTQ